MKKLWGGKVEKIEKLKIKFQKIVKNRKKQNFTFLTTNPVPILLFSTRKLSWLFFEIGIENGFSGGINEKKFKNPNKSHFFRG